MSFEVFLCPVGTRPLSSALPATHAIQRWLEGQPHVRRLERWAAYYNPNTSAELQVDWSDSHICWTLPVCRTRATALEAAALLERFCRELGVRPLWWPAESEADLAGVAGAIVTRWDLANDAARHALSQAP